MDSRASSAALHVRLTLHALWLSTVPGWLRPVGSSTGKGGGLGACLGKCFRKGGRKDIAFPYSQLNEPLFSCDRYDKPPQSCFLKAGNVTPTWKADVVAFWPAGHGPIPPPPPPGPPGPPRPAPQCYAASLERFDPRPVLSFVDGSSTFAQVFNPSWVQPSTGTQGRQGLLVRTQNCTGPGCSLPTSGKCCQCSGTGAAASVITFAQLLSDTTTDNSTTDAPRFQ